MSVLFQTLENNKVVCYFYGLIPIPFDETAEGLKNVLVKRLEDDSIYEEVRTRTVAFIRYH